MELPEFLVLAIIVCGIRELSTCCARTSSESLSRRVPRKRRVLFEIGKMYHKE